MTATDQDLLEDKIQKVRFQDHRFSRHAYFFVLDALDYTMTHFGRDNLTGEDRHVGGRELLVGIKEYAADQFGPMAALVFERWGIRGASDFGEIVLTVNGAPNYRFVRSADEQVIERDALVVITAYDSDAHRHVVALAPESQLPAPKTPDPPEVKQAA